jgi:hypothetical protein
MENLEANEYAPFYKPYIEMVANDGKNIVENLEDSIQYALRILRALPYEKHVFRYAEGKWTIKEIVQHLIDTERVFNYRALRFARWDPTDLAGFNENLYVENSNANYREFIDLLEEFATLRKNTVLLYKSFSHDALVARGTANDNTMSVRALGYITSGHVLHHLKVIQERYLP